jgi:hypothetical protein
MAGKESSPKPWAEREAEMQFYNGNMRLVEGVLVSEDDARQLATDISDLLAEIERLREGHQVIRDMNFPVDVEDVKYVQACQWHDMKSIARQALEGR